MSLDKYIPPLPHLPGIWSCDNILGDTELLTRVEQERQREYEQKTQDSEEKSEK